MAPVTGDHAVWYFRVFNALVAKYAAGQQILFLVAVADETYGDANQVSYYLFGPSPPPMNETFDTATKNKCVEMFSTATAFIDDLKLTKNIKFFRSGVSGAGGRNGKRRCALAFVEQSYTSTSSTHEDTLNAIQFRGFDVIDKIVASSDNIVVVTKPYKSHGGIKSSLRYPVEHNRVLNWRWFTPTSVEYEDDNPKRALYTAGVCIRIEHATAEFQISIVVADVYGSQAYCIEHKWSVQNKTKKTIEFLANEDVLRVCQMFNVQLVLVARDNDVVCSCPSCAALYSITVAIPNGSWLLGESFGQAPIGSDSCLRQAPVSATAVNGSTMVVYWSSFAKQSVFYQTFIDGHQMDKPVRLWIDRYMPYSTASVEHCACLSRGAAIAVLTICLWTISKCDSLSDWVLRPIENIGDSGILTLEGDTITNLCLREVCKLYTPSTPMGRRALEHRLFNPPSDVAAINRLYDLSDSVARLVVNQTAETRFFGPQDLNKLINDMKRGKTKYADLMAVYNSLDTLVAHPWVKCSGASTLLDFYKVERLKNLIDDTFDIVTLDTIMSKTMTETKLTAIDNDKLKNCLSFDSLSSAADTRSAADKQILTETITVPVGINTKQYKYLIEVVDSGSDWCLNRDIIGSKVAKQFIAHFEVSVPKFLEHVARIQLMYLQATSAVQKLAAWKTEDSTFCALYYCRGMPKVQPVMYIRIPNYAADVLEQKIKKNVPLSTGSLMSGSLKIKKNIKATDDADDASKKRAGGKASMAATSFVKIHKRGHRDAAVFRLLQQLVDEFCAVFGSWLYTNYVTDLFEIASAIGHLDATIAIVTKSAPDKLNLIRPSLEPIQTKAGLKTTGLKHAYINEQLKTSVDGRSYYAHDINLGFDGAASGVLLYGVNTSGKSTVLRAIGTSIVMAQAGFGVPATTYVLRPYSAIVTHINVSDCVHTGRSKFERQCIETNVVQQYSGATSLILADELYNGTSHHEVVSLTVAAVERYVEKQWSFIVTSHEMSVLNYLFDGSPRPAQVAVKSIDYKPPDRPIVDGLVFDADSQYGLSTFRQVGGDMVIATRAAEIQQQIVSTNAKDSTAVKQYYRVQQKQDLPTLLASTQEQTAAAARLASKFDQFRFKRKAINAPHGCSVETKRPKTSEDCIIVSQDKQKTSSYNAAKIKTGYCERSRCCNNSKFGGAQVATEVHHIVPREVLRMYPEYVQYQHCVWNLKELCLPCHQEITTRDATRKAENKVAFRTAYMQKFNRRRQQAGV